MGGKNSVAIVAELGSVWKTCFLAAEDVGGIGRRPALASDPNEEVVYGCSVRERCVDAIGIACGVAEVRFILHGRRIALRHVAEAAHSAISPTAAHLSR